MDISNESENQSNNGALIYVCETCRKTFSSHEFLKIHMNYVCGQKNYKCQICRKPFGESEELKKHMKIVHNETQKKHKWYKCDKCEKSYVRQAGLKKHLKDHKDLNLNVKQHKCVPCGKIFRFEKNFNEHIEIVHEEGKDKNCEIIEIEDDENEIIEIEYDKRVL